MTEKKQSTKEKMVQAIWEDIKKGSKGWQLGLDLVKTEIEEAVGKLSQSNKRL